MGAPGPRARLRPRPRPTPTRRANSCVKSPRKTARTRCPPASAWPTKRRRRSRRWRLRKKVKPGEAVGSPGWRAGRGRAPPLARAAGGAAEPSETLHGAGNVAGPKFTPLARSQARREPSRLGRTERAPRGRPGRSRRFLPGARLLAQGARGAARALLPARRALGCRCLLRAPALPSCPTMARTPKERPGLGVSTWAASRFGGTVESGGRSCCLGPTCAFCVVPFRSYVRSSCNLLA